MLPTSQTAVKVDRQNYAPTGRTPEGLPDNVPGDLDHAVQTYARFHLFTRDEAELTFEAAYWGPAGPPADPVELDRHFRHYRASRADFLARRGF